MGIAIYDPLVEEWSIGDDNRTGVDRYYAGPSSTTLAITLHQIRCNEKSSILFEEARLRSKCAAIRELADRSREAERASRGSRESTGGGGQAKPHRRLCIWRGTVPTYLAPWKMWRASGVAAGSSGSTAWRHIHCFRPCPIPFNYS